ncbi:MAG: 50S ribosomal protein L35 [Thermodesulfobacteriota bacterium]
MPKIKTNRGAAKRFKITATGKIKMKRAGMRHILTSKATGTKRVLRKGSLVDSADVKAVRRMLPNG